MLKSKLFWLIIAGLLLVTSMAGAAQPLNLTISYASKNPGEKPFHTLKLYLSDGNKLRIDFLSAEGALNATSIYRNDKGVSWGIDPLAKTYVELPLTKRDWEHGLSWLFTDYSQYKKTGTTKCLNLPADIYERVSGEWTNIFVIAQGMELNLDSELKQNGKTVQINTAADLKFERPADSLFQLPAGYKKVTPVF